MNMGPPFVPDCFKNCQLAINRNKRSPTILQLNLKTKTVRSTFASHDVLKQKFEKRNLYVFDMNRKNLLHTLVDMYVGTASFLENAFVVLTIFLIGFRAFVVLTIFLIGFRNK